MDHFLLSHQNFTQNSARNSKIGSLKSLVKKLQKNCSFQGPKIDFWIQCFIGYFGIWHVSRILKSHPIWMRLKVEVKSLLSALWYANNFSRSYLYNFQNTKHRHYPRYRHSNYYLYYNFLHQNMDLNFPNQNLRQKLEFAFLNWFETLYYGSWLYHFVPLE